MISLLTTAIVMPYPGRRIKMDDTATFVKQAYRLNARAKNPTKILQETSYTGPYAGKLFATINSSAATRPAAAAAEASIQVPSNMQAVAVKPVNAKERHTARLLQVGSEAKISFKDIRHSSGGV